MTPADLPPDLARIAVDARDCWIWLGPRSPNGYGNVRRTTAHRAVYQHVHGIDLPRSADVDHLCRVRLCVNPAHLEAVSRRENLRRGLNGVLRTHCKRGHEVIPENLGFLKRGPRAGERYCRLCANLRVLERYHRLKREAAA